MNYKEVYSVACHDCYHKRYPLYAVLVAADEKILAQIYREGWRSVWGDDLCNYRDSGGTLPPRTL